LKHTKKDLSNLQSRSREAGKKGDAKELEKVRKLMMEKQSAMMARSFKPMVFTSLPLIFLFQWLRNYRPLMDYVAH
jgi:uncharacterized membrane protein (DUF106 family)